MIDISTPVEVAYPVLTIRQAANRLNISQDVLLRWEREGLLVPERVGSRRDRRYDEDIIDRITVTPHQAEMGAPRLLPVIGPKEDIAV